MIEASSIAIFLVAAGTSLFMAWTIGAGSSGSTPFAPAVGANAIPIMRAAFLVGILGFAGAVIQGGSVSEAVGQDLVIGVTLSPLAAVLGLLTAGLLVAAGVYTGYPIATAFTVTGAVVGVGLASGGEPAMAKYREIAGLWIAIPIVGGSLAYTTARLLRDNRLSERETVMGLAALVGLIIANIEFVFLGPPGETNSLAFAVAKGFTLTPSVIRTAIVVLVSFGIAVTSAAIVRIDMTNDVEAGQRRFLLVLGSLVAFSAGGSQVGLAVGPLLPLRDSVALPLIWLLIGGGFGLLLGSWTGAPRMIKAVSQDYSSLGPKRSIAALTPSFIIAQVAILFSIPVSFNEIIISAIVGSGYAVGEEGVGRQKIVYTIVAWIGSLVLAFVVSYSSYTAITTI